MCAFFMKEVLKVYVHYGVYFLLASLPHRLIGYSIHVHTIIQFPHLHSVKLVIIFMKIDFYPVDGYFSKLGIVIVDCT